MTQLLILALALVGCRRGETAPGTDSGTPPPPVCDPMNDGEWSAIGPAFGMPMTTTVTFDVDACAFVAQDWSMVHSSQMTGGTVNGDEVTLTGNDAYWSSCVGTLVDGASISGVCSAAVNDGTFTLTHVD